MCIRKNKIQDLVRIIPFNLGLSSYFPISLIFLWLSAFFSPLSVSVSCLCSILINCTAFIDVFWLNVEKGIVCCCQSRRLQLWGILIAHPPKISRWHVCWPHISEKHVFSSHFGEKGIQNWGVKQNWRTSVFLLETLICFVLQVLSLLLKTDRYLLQCFIRCRWMVIFIQCAFFVLHSQANVDV